MENILIKDVVLLNTVIDFTMALNNVSVKDLKDMELSKAVDYVIGLIPETKKDEMDIDNLHEVVEYCLINKLS